MHDLRAKSGSQSCESVYVSMRMRISKNIYNIYVIYNTCTYCIHIYPHVIIRRLATPKFAELICHFKLKARKTITDPEPRLPASVSHQRQERRGQGERELAVHPPLPPERTCPLLLCVAVSSRPVCELRSHSLAGLATTCQGSYYSRIRFQKQYGALIY